MGTAAGVMTSRAVRRLQEPARWVPAALNAMLFTPWSPHLNLPGHRDQHTRNQSKPKRCLDSLQHQPRIRSQKQRRRRWMIPTGQSTKRRRQEVTSEEALQTSSSAGTAAGTTTDSSMEKTISGCDFTHSSSRVQFLCSHILRIGSKKIPWNKRDGLAEKLGNCVQATGQPR